MRDLHAGQGRVPQRHAVALSIPWDDTHRGDTANQTALAGLTSVKPGHRLYQLIKTERGRA
jgi:hypothetical protein